TTVPGAAVPDRAGPSDCAQMKYPSLGAHKKVLLRPAWTQCRPGDNAETLCARIEEPSLRSVAGEILDPASERERGLSKLVVTEQSGPEMAGVALHAQVWVLRRPDILRFGRQGEIA